MNANTNLPHDGGQAATGSVGTLPAVALRILRGLLNCLRQWPALIAVTVSCLIAGENYPFSNFPMYATFGDATYMVYVTDGNGDPVPVFDTFGMRTSVLKKIYHKEAMKAVRSQRLRMNELEPRHLEPAGRLALERLLMHRTDMPPHGYDALGLVHLNITLEDGKIVRRHLPVATWRKESSP